MSKPLCPYCKAEWTDDMIAVEELSASEGCETCGYGQEITGKVVITCSECKKVIYVKEFSDYPNGG